MIGPITPYGSVPISPYRYSGIGFGTAGSTGSGEADAMAVSTSGSVGSAGRSESADKAGAVVNPGESTRVNPGRKSSPAECQTCKERKYQDGSNEMVSFKSASHISPNAAGTAVRAHEQEHVANAYKKASQNNGKVVSCSVSIHTAICPECGRSYVSGGTTSTSIKYSNQSNPYVKNMKAQQADALSGANVDMAV